MSIFSILFLGLLIIVLPLMSFQTRDILDEVEVKPSKRSMYLQSIIMLTVIGVLSGVVDFKEDLGVHWTGKFSVAVISFCALLYLSSMAVNLINYKFFQRDKGDDDFIMPSGKQEYLLWLLLCFTASWAEEYAYRGVMPALLEKVGLLPFLAALLSAATFSFSHYTQGWLAIPITFVFALGFQYLYEYSGMLLAPVLVHFLYNLSIEFVRRKLVKKSL